jgi:hypothetical protein
VPSSARCVCGECRSKQDSEPPRCRRCRRSWYSTRYGSESGTHSNFRTEYRRQPAGPSRSKKTLPIPSWCPVVERQALAGPRKMDGKGPAPTSCSRELLRVRRRRGREHHPHARRAMGEGTFRPPLAGARKLVTENSPLAHSARPPLNAHLRTRGGHMRRLNTPLSDCRVYSWALLSVTDAK